MNFTTRQPVGPRHHTAHRRPGQKTAGNSIFCAVRHSQDECMTSRSSLLAELPVIRSIQTVSRRPLSSDRACSEPCGRSQPVCHSKHQVVVTQNGPDDRDGESQTIQIQNWRIDDVDLWVCKARAVNTAAALGCRNPLIQDHVHGPSVCGSRRSRWPHSGTISWPVREARRTGPAHEIDRSTRRCARVVKQAR